MAVSKGRSSFKKTIQDESKHEKLGDMLRKDGRITGRQLKMVEEIQKKQNIWIGSILISKGYISEEALINFISKSLTIPVFNPKESPPLPETLKLIEHKDAMEQMFVPIKSDEKSIVIAMRDPTNFKALEFVAATTKLAVKTEVISLKALVDLYKEHYGISNEESQAFFPKTEKEDVLHDDRTSDVNFDLGEIISSAEDELEIAEEYDDGGPDEITAGDAAIVKLVNGILINAVKKGSSDVHIEPYEKKLRVRYRADGKLSEDMNLPLQMKKALISRIKIMASLNIAERRVPQDGRIKIRIGSGRVVDFRVSVLPTLFGESVVMRLLDQSKLQVDMTKLGFSEKVLAKFKSAIKSPQGMVLVTGPTGSGKTNTLYSAINALNKEDVKILTAEDPVEFNFEGINQVHVRSEVGMTFAAALRAFLRQDPEIILVGEIRDLETAEIAVKAAMTGHLVFSTLHTNDCPSTIARMVDIGVPGYMLSSSLIMVVAQRLLRRLCPHCKEVDTSYSVKDLLDMGFKKEELGNLKIMKGKGCPQCTDGYKGRVGCFEVMEVNEALKQAITAGIPEDQLRKIAIKGGMLTLRRDGLDKVAEGVTTAEEVLANTVLQAESLPAYLLNPDELTFEDGDLIIREGNTDKNFYKLLQGALVIVKSGRVVGEITQPDEYFGEMSALLNQPRVATIKSRGKSVVKVFPGERLKETLENHPNIALRIIKSLNSRLSEADKLLARVMEKTGNR